ncbi:MAG TPA: hypothetical protein DEF05_08430 [Erwinia sp.]|uniref:hypothetical protein n=1 Tax=Erwinia citreus TaxID=558 RepID=UPI000E8C2D3E|nr:hypothetical protein [Erwinia sp.]HBV39694.1 hypothetical protein [Erwinia sp.]
MAPLFFACCYLNPALQTHLKKNLFCPFIRHINHKGQQNSDQRLYLFQQDAKDVARLLQSLITAVTPFVTESSQLWVH